MPYAWEVERNNAQNRVDQGQTDINAGNQSGRIQAPGTSPARDAQVGNQAMGATGVRTPQLGTDEALRSGSTTGDTSGTATAFKVGDTVRLKGGKGQTFKIDSVENGVYSGKVVGKGATKGATTSAREDEIELWNE